MTSIAGILSALEERTIARQIGIPHDEARMRFPLHRNTVDGVDSYQRVACFRLAVHLKLAGIPRDLAAVLLKAWAGKNHPAGKQIITPPEIDSQVRGAYAKAYRSCGCEDPRIRIHCQPQCPLLWHAPRAVRDAAGAGGEHKELKEDACCAS